MEKRSLGSRLLRWGYRLAILGVLLAILAALSGKNEGNRYSWTEGKGPKIGVVEIKGVIGSSKETIEQLVELRRDPAITAIVVRVDSPGGAVAPSQEIARAIQRAKKDKKVVVSMGTVAASGGYYIASAADRIYALPGTITASIGVISEFPEVDALLDFARVKVRTIKAGAMKDVGSPLRPMTDGERAYLQSFVDGIHEQFIDDVAAGRGLDKEAVRRIADGRILTGQQALAEKLVDEMGNLEEAIEGAAKLAGATGTPVPVWKKPKRSLFGELLRDGADGMVSGARSAVEESAAGSIEARDPRL